MVYFSIFVVDRRYPIKKDHLKMPVKYQVYFIAVVSNDQRMAAYA